MHRLHRIPVVGLAVAGLLGVTAAFAPAAQASLSGFDALKSYAAQPVSVVSPADGEAWVSSPADGATALDHYAGGTWTHSEVAGVTAGHLYASASNDMWLRSNDALRHYDGSVWTPVPLPTGPDGETLSAVALADAPGPDAYVGFSYFSVESPYATAVGHWDGTSWTLLPWPFTNEAAETFDDLAYAGGALVARFENYPGLGQYIASYTEAGGWTNPVNIGQDVSGFSWNNDWVVNGPDDVWLYGEDSGATGQVARCGHFDGTAADFGSCVAGSGGPIYAATKMPDGRHMVGSSGFDLLQQPGSQLPVGSIGVTHVIDLSAEPTTGVAWAVAQRQNDYAVLRYGVASDASQFVVQAQASSGQVERGDVVTISGTAFPAVPVAADRRVVLQVKNADGWTKVVADRTAANGAFRFDVEQAATGTVRYRVFKPAVGPIAGAYSSVITVKVIEPFTLTITGPSQVQVGKKAVITGKVTPTVTDPQARTVVLQIKSGTEWRTVTTSTTAASGSYRFEVVKSTAGTFRYRVEKTAAEGRTARFSPAISIIVVG